MDGTTTITFPNEGKCKISTEILSKWIIDDINVIRNTVFCTLDDNSVFSMDLSDYVKIFGHNE
jgi:hypothetical protein